MPGPLDLADLELVPDDTDRSELLFGPASTITLRTPDHDPADELAVMEAAILRYRGPLWLEEAKKYDPKLHPRWPKGTPRAGKFMRVGQRFDQNGKTWEIANVFDDGTVVAHDAGGNVENVGEQVFQAKVGDIGDGQKGLTLPSAAPATPKLLTGSGKIGGYGDGEMSNVTVIDPYVDHASHDPSIPLPAGSKFTADEWKQFGRIDQLRYVELMKQFGPHKSSVGTSLVQQAYSEFQDVASDVSGAYASQYGSSSGYSISLIGFFHSLVGGHNKDALVKAQEKRERAKELQNEIAAVVQWDLYNRTHSPDLSVFHRDASHEPDWWQKIIHGKIPVFTGLSQSWQFENDTLVGFGNTMVATPVAIRHIAMSTYSAAMESSGSKSFSHEQEISVADQMRLDPKRSVVFKVSQLGNKKNWIADKASKPVGGWAVDQLHDALLGKGDPLPIPAEPLKVSMNGTGGKQWVDPPKAVYEEKNFAPGGKLPFASSTPLGAPVTLKDLEVKPGDYIMGLKGTVYVILADPGDSSGLGIAYHKVSTKNWMTGQAEGAVGGNLGETYNFEGGGVKPFYKLTAHYTLPAAQGPSSKEFDAAAWTPSTDEKLISDLDVGTKFKAHGKVYEITKKSDGYGFPADVKDLDTGKFGTANGDAKTIYLVPAEGYVPPVDPNLYKPTAGDFVKVTLPDGTTRAGIVDPYDSKNQELWTVHTAFGGPTTPVPASSLEPIKYSPDSLQAGDVFAKDGQTFTVTGTLKDGTVKAKPQGGKVQKFPKDTPFVANAYRPSDWAVGDKQKGKAFEAGDLFTVGTGQKIKPYLVLGVDLTDIHWRNLQTGEVGKTSRNKSFAKLVPAVPDVQTDPAPDHSTPEDPAVTGEFDQTAYNWGDAVVFEQLPVGTVFKSGGGAAQKKVSDTDAVMLEGGQAVAAGETWQPNPKQGYFVGTAKAEGGTTQYSKLTMGDPVQLGDLKAGDTFKGYDSKVTFQLVTPPAGSDSNAVYAPVMPDGTLGPATSNFGFPTLVVNFQHFSAEKPVLTPVNVDPDSLPEPPGFVPFKWHKSSGGIKYAKIKELTDGTVFADKAGNVWMVKSAGADAIITDGEHNYAVAGDLRVRAADQFDHILALNDNSPPIGGTSATATHDAQVAAFYLNKNVDGTTLGNLELGTTFQAKGGTFKVYDQGASGTQAQNLKTGKITAFPADVEPSSIGKKVVTVSDTGFDPSKYAAVPDVQFNAVPVGGYLANGDGVFVWKKTGDSTVQAVTQFGAPVPNPKDVPIDPDSLVQHYLPVAPVTAPAPEVTIDPDAALVGTPAEQFTPGQKVVSLQDGKVYSLPATLAYGGVVIVKDDQGVEHTHPAADFTSKVPLGSLKVGDWVADPNGLAAVVTQADDSHVVYQTLDGWKGTSTNPTFQFMPTPKLPLMPDLSPGDTVVKGHAAEVQQGAGEPQTVLSVDPVTHLVKLATSDGGTEEVLGTELTLHAPATHDASSTTPGPTIQKFMTTAEAKQALYRVGEKVQVSDLKQGNMLKLPNGKLAYFQQVGETKRFYLLGSTTEVHTKAQMVTRLHFALPLITDPDELQPKGEATLKDMPLGSYFALGGSHWQLIARGEDGTVHGRRVEEDGDGNHPIAVGAAQHQQAVVTEYVPKIGSPFAVGDAVTTADGVSGTVSSTSGPEVKVATGSNDVTTHDADSLKMSEQHPMKGYTTHDAKGTDLKAGDVFQTVPGPTQAVYQMVDPSPPDGGPAKIKSLWTAGWNSGGHAGDEIVIGWGKGHGAPNIPVVVRDPGEMEWSAMPDGATFYGKGASSDKTYTKLDDGHYSEVGGTGIFKYTVGHSGTWKVASLPDKPAEAAGFTPEKGQAVEVLDSDGSTWKGIVQKQVAGQQEWIIKAEDGSLHYADAYDLAPAEGPVVGQPITSEEQMDALPVGTVVGAYENQPYIADFVKEPAGTWKPVNGADFHHPASSFLGGSYSIKSLPQRGDENGYGAEDPEIDPTTGEPFDAQQPANEPIHSSSLEVGDKFDFTPDGINHYVVTDVDLNAQTFAAKNPETGAEWSGSMNDVNWAYNVEKGVGMQPHAVHHVSEMKVGDVYKTDAVYGLTWQIIAMKGSGRAAEATIQLIGRDPNAPKASQTEGMKLGDTDKIDGGIEVKVTMRPLVKFGSGASSPSIPDGTLPAAPAFHTFAVGDSVWTLGGQKARKVDANHVLTAGGETYPIGSDEPMYVDDPMNQSSAARMPSDLKVGDIYTDRPFDDPATLGWRVTDVSDSKYVEAEGVDGSSSAALPKSSASPVYLAPEDYDQYAGMTTKEDVVSVNGVPTDAEHAPVGGLKRGQEVTWNSAEDGPQSGTVIGFSYGDVKVKKPGSDDLEFFMLKPESLTPVNDPLEPYKWHKGAGGKVHYMQLKQIPAGVSFIDKADHRYTMGAVEGGVAHYTDKDGNTYATSPKARVLVVGPWTSAGEGDVEHAALNAYAKSTTAGVTSFTGYESSVNAAGKPHTLAGAVPLGALFYGKDGSMWLRVATASDGTAIVIDPMGSSSGYYTLPGSSWVSLA